ncbi:MAG: hypothetical protein ACK4WF_05155 [Candidatus Brocadiales bacterium]
MEETNVKFTNYHATQYKNSASDLRFYADQRFKVAGVFLLTNGILANVASNHSSIVLGLLGIFLSYLCLSWEKCTTVWWGILFEGIKALENSAKDDGFMNEVYTKYPSKSIWPFVKATHAVEGLYYLATVGWVLFVAYSWPSLW